MGLIGDLIKIGFGGLVAGTVVNSAVREAKGEKNSCYLVLNDSGLNFEKVLNIKPNKIEKIYDFLISRIKESGFGIAEKRKPKFISFQKKDFWKNETVSIRLKRIENKILLEIKCIMSSFGMGSENRGKEFQEESENLTKLIENIFN